jgi:UDP-GlcNAc3NAcA epimerase
MKRPLNIITIVGARPQFIKSAIVSKSFKKCSNINEIIIHTGQHYDFNMSDIFFNELKIENAKYNLGIGGGSHGQNTGRMIERIEDILIKIKPKGVLVYGDTDSTLAGALSAAKLNIPVFHVEAGLRSYNKIMPEEINRVLTDHVSDLLFTPGSNATKTLMKEGIEKTKIFEVGDVMYDLFIETNKNYNVLNKYFTKKTNIDKNYLLLTLHIQENVVDHLKLKRLFKVLNKLKYEIIWPIHPRTRYAIKKNNISLPKNIKTIPPVGYYEMMNLQKNAKIILTDSGGVQKEAFFNKVPCITLREETEWIELVEAGVNKLTGINNKKIIDAFNSFNKFIYPKKNQNLYGNGKASQKIVKIIKSFLELR